MKLKLAVVQFEPEDGNIEGNLAKIEQYIAKAAANGAKLVVLPEICDIGYNFDEIARKAESSPNKSTAAIAKLAKEKRAIIVAGLAERRKDGLYNTAVIFDSNGDIKAVYDKTHLCPLPPFDEPKVFKPGNSIFVTEIEGIKLGVTICFDIRFPEVYRKLAGEGAQVIIHPTAFPKIRIGQLEACLCARAIENQYFIATANFCGMSGNVEFGGCSMIVDPSGNVMSEKTMTDEGFALAEIDLAEIEKQRKENPVFSQRRPELYK